MLCNHCTEKLLGLEEVIVKNINQFLDRTEIYMELPRKAHICPCCGQQTVKKAPAPPIIVVLTGLSGMDKLLH
jgi:transposase